jgi:hypothetical protein
MDAMHSLAIVSPESVDWRAFAAEHAASPVQRPGWLDTLTGAYNLRARIAALTDTTGAIVAAFPMIHSKLPWRGRWTSLPFTDTLEPVAVDEARRGELLRTLSERPGIEPILIHAHADLPGWFSREVGTVQVLEVADGAEGVLREVSAGTRREVARAQRAETGLTARPIANREDFLDQGLVLIARSRQRLGAPTQPRRYWSLVWDLCEHEEAVAIGVYRGAQLLAIGVFIVGSHHAVYKYSASDHATRHLRTNYLMLASAFDHLAARGVSSMDFGISDLRNTGLRKFKARWGGEERPVRFSATDPRVLPDTLEPGRLVTKAIQRTPVFVGRTVGAVAYPFVA